MKKKTGKRCRFICASLCMALCAVLFAESAIGTVHAAKESETAKNIKKKEQEIEEKKKEQEALKDSISDLKEITEALEAQKADLKEYVVQLDSNLALIEQNIADLQARIVVKEEEISRTQEELEAALGKEENQKESVISCIRMIYESGRPNLVELLLKASSFGDFLNKADYAEKVVAYDHQLWQDYKGLREYTELCKEELELEKTILDQTKASVEIEQNNLEALIRQKGIEIANYENDINNKEKVIKEYEEELKSQEEELKALEAAVAEEKKKLLEEQALIYDGGMFHFPLESYTRVSSDYGYRIHPILKVRQFHNGVDFAAPKGTPIYAAYDGVVVAATYSATMGNYVMIDHGSELYTIYMHASALYVKKGQAVLKGETIAGVGTTGRSTGNHLHFSVRLNGSYVSPWDYLKE